MSTAEIAGGTNCPTCEPVQWITRPVTNVSPSRYPQGIDVEMTPEHCGRRQGDAGWVKLHPLAGLSQEI